MFPTNVTNVKLAAKSVAKLSLLGFLGFHFSLAFATVGDIRNQVNGSYKLAENQISSERCLKEIEITGYPLLNIFGITPGSAVLQMSTVRRGTQITYEINPMTGEKTGVRQERSQLSPGVLTYWFMASDYPYIKGKTLIGMERRLTATFGNNRFDYKESFFYQSGKDVGEMTCFYIKK